MGEGLFDIGAVAFVTLFVAIDPIGLVPIFIALTRDTPAAYRRQVARKGTLIAAVILLIFAVAGEAGLRQLGIGLPAFRIAGGITLLLLALEMVFERRAQRRSNTAEHLHGEMAPEEIAAFPLAIPLIAGPAAITSVILQMSRVGADLGGQIAVCLALGAVLAVTYGVLTASALIGRWLRPTLVVVLSRLLGLLLAALAVQYLIDGIAAAL